MGIVQRASDGAVRLSDKGPPSSRDERIRQHRLFSLRLDFLAVRSCETKTSTSLQPIRPWNVRTRQQNLRAENPSVPIVTAEWYTLSPQKIQEIYRDLGEFVPKTAINGSLLCCIKQEGCGSDCRKYWSIGKRWQETSRRKCIALSYYDIKQVMQRRV